jgi:hypothetical protein
LARARWASCSISPATSCRSSAPAAAASAGSPPGNCTGRRRDDRADRHRAAADRHRVAVRHGHRAVERAAVDRGTAAKVDEQPLSTAKAELAVTWRDSVNEPPVAIGARADHQVGALQRNLHGLAGSGTSARQE